MGMGGGYRDRHCCWSAGFVDFFETCRQELEMNAQGCRVGLHSQQLWLVMARKWMLVQDLVGLGIKVSVITGW